MASNSLGKSLLIEIEIETLLLVGRVLNSLFNAFTELQRTRTQGSDAVLHTLLQSKHKT